MIIVTLLWSEIMGGYNTPDTIASFFNDLPEPNRACLVGHVVWYTESYRNLTPVGFGRRLVYQVT